MKIRLLRRHLLKLLIPEWVWPREVVLNGVKIPVRNTPYSFGTKWILLKGHYEAIERKLLEPILQKGMQVLEMGSSIGIVTAIIADKIGRSGKMVAIEASESLFNYSSKWLAKYPQLQLVHGFAFPVAEAPGIQIDSFDEVRGNLGGVVAFIQESSGSKGDERVWDINRICWHFNLQPELLVIDIEGSETVMANTPLNLPQSIKYILIEFHAGLIPGGIKDVEAIKNALEEEGFNLKESSYSVCLFVR